jgi:hypothetical protein
MRIFIEDGEARRGGGLFPRGTVPRESLTGTKYTE